MTFNKFKSTMINKNKIQKLQLLKKKKSKSQFP